MRAPWLNNDQKKKKYVEKTLGQKANALQDLSNGMAMRVMEKSKILTLHEFSQNKQ